MVSTTRSQREALSELTGSDSVPNCWVTGLKPNFFMAFVDLTLSLSQASTLVDATMVPRRGKLVFNQYLNDSEISRFVFCIRMGIKPLLKSGKLAQMLDAVKGLDAGKL